MRQLSHYFCVPRPRYITFYNTYMINAPGLFASTLNARHKKIATDKLFRNCVQRKVRVIKKLIRKTTDVVISGVMRALICCIKIVLTFHDSHAYLPFIQFVVSQIDVIMIYLYLLRKSEKN